MNKMKKGISLSDMILSEEDKKKAEGLAKPKPELTPEQERKEKVQVEKAREPYIITLFKMINKPNWRMSSENPFPKPENIAEIKIIRIDRVTGEII